MEAEEKRRKHREYQRAWRSSHPEQARAQQKRYRERHSEDVANKTAAWRASNPERVREYQKRYREKHKKQLASKNAAWRAANPDKVRAIRAKGMRKIHTNDMTIIVPSDAQCRARRLLHSKILKADPDKYADQILRRLRSDHIGSGRGDELSGIDY